MFVLYKLGVIVCESHRANRVIGSVTDTFSLPEVRDGAESPNKYGDKNPSVAVLKIASSL